ncbi:hypothetical protein H0X06_01005 [Candidatus Dependentiae bacterium]|nr:hypothetical protein [Candidatus Dependentiae bacterium]
MIIFKRVSLTRAVQSAFSTYGKNSRFFLTVSGLTFLIYLTCIVIHISFLCISFSIKNFCVLPSNLMHTVQGLFSIQIITLLWSVALLALFELYYYQLLRFCIQIYEGTTPSWKSFFTESPTNFFWYFLARTLYRIKCMLGLLLFIIPGVLYALKNYFTGYSIAHSLTESIKEDALLSRKFTADTKGRIFLLLCLNAVAYSLLGILYPLILPLIILIDLHVYKQLMAPYDSTETVL